MAKKRGPGFPGISLPEAIEKIRPVVLVEPHNAMTGEALAQHLGYKGVSGASLSMMADLRRYALIEGRGDEIRVSRDALMIITDENAEDQSDRVAALARCALNDNVFSNIASNNKGIPAEATLVSSLIKNGFNSDSAREAAVNYIETMKFVDEQSKGYNTNDESKDKTSIPDTQKQNRKGMTDYKIPIASDTYAVLTGPFPLDSAAWNQMIAVLNAMKPGLVAENKPDMPDTNEEKGNDIFS